MTLYVGDRATGLAAGNELPIEQIAVGAAKEWSGRHLRAVDLERHLRCHVLPQCPVRTSIPWIVRAVAWTGSTSLCSALQLKTPTRGRLPAVTESTA